MTLAAVHRITELLEAGATVAGWRPDSSPSRSDDPAAWAAAVEALWTQRPGLLDLAGVAVSDGVATAFARMGLDPDWTVMASEDAKLPAIHRRLNGADLYFLSNQLERPEKVVASFRGEAASAEVWDPVQVSRSAVGMRVEAGRTAVNLHLEPFGSAFILLRHNRSQPTGDPAPLVHPRQQEMATELPLAGPWEVTFDGDGQSPKPIVMATPAPWSGPQTSDYGACVTYFSGTATYSATFNVELELGGPDARMVLDLGEVHDLAGIRLNGQDVGVLWTPPFRIDVTEAARIGRNLLEVSVTNAWANRLMGDAAEGLSARPGSQVFEADSQPLAAGLRGPVRLLVTAAG